MTQGFYEQLGVDQGAGREALQDAYTRVVAQLVRRRKAVVDQGGDTSRLDLARAQVDEAWSVLSDPARRRRYDALVGLTERGMPSDPEELWEQVRGALVSPATAAAVELVRGLTRVDVGAVSTAFESGRTSTGVDPDEPTQALDTQADVPTEAFPDVPSHVAPMPTGAGLRMPIPPTPVVRGSATQAPAATPVAAPSRPTIRLGGPPNPAPASSGPDIGVLLERHGYGGALITAVRTAKGLSVHDLGEATRISVRYLTAIEADDHDHLPSTTFVRGYLKEVARTLGLEADALVSGYMRRMGK